MKPTRNRTIWRVIACSGRIVLFSWFAFFFMSTGVFARTLHVAPAPTGSDSYTGTATQPFATVNKAATASMPGDTILIRGGTYTLTAQIAPVSGTTAARITYLAAPGASVVINGGSGYCVGLSGKSFITFDGLKFTTSSTAVGAGMVYFEGSRHCTFVNCEFYGMPVEQGSENTSVIRCMSTGYPDVNNTGNSDTCIFRNNHFHDNAAPAMRLYDTKGWVIENNKFVNCLHAVGGKDEAYDMLIRRNLIVNCGLAFYFPGQGGSRNVAITENIVVNGTVFLTGGLGTMGAWREGMSLYNNTFYECTYFITGWDDGYTTGQNYYNNICYSATIKNIGGGEDVAARFVNMSKYGGTPMAAANYYIDYNCLQIPASDNSAWFIDNKVSFSSLAAWKTAKPPFEAHSISANPLFVDAANADYHLQTGSPCRAAGKNNEDMGAYPRGNDGTIIGLLSESGTAVKNGKPDASSIPTMKIPAHGSYSGSRYVSLQGRSIEKDAPLSQIKGPIYDRQSGRMIMKIR